MPKAILEFNLPEEESELEMALKATEWMCVVHNLLNNLRNKLKYEDDKYTKKEIELLEELQESIYDDIGHYGLKL